MPISYNKLWKLLIDKKLRRIDLKYICGISSNVLARLGKDAPVSMDSLEKICIALECNIGDIMQFVEVDK